MDNASKPFVQIGQLLTSVALIVLLIVTLVMGIKYMLASPEKRATLKNQLIGLVVSAIIIFTAHVIWSISVNLLTGAVEEGGKLPESGTPQPTSGIPTSTPIPTLTPGPSRPPNSPTPKPTSTLTPPPEPETSIPEIPSSPTPRPSSTPQVSATPSPTQSTAPSPTLEPTTSR